MENNQKSNKNDKFIPEGAIAFFTLLILLGFLIWVGAYLKYIIGL